MTTKTTRTGGRRRPWVLIAVIAGVVIAVGGFVAMIESSAGAVASDPAAAIVTGEVDDHEIAVVTYATDTFPHLDLFRIPSMGMSVQAEAFDLDTGERLWDTTLDAEFQHTEAGAVPLGIVAGQVYVAAYRGLIALDATTGAVLEREAALPDLDAVEAERWTAVIDEVRQEDAAVFRGGERVPTSFWAPLPGGESAEPTWAADGWDVGVLLDADAGFAAGADAGFAVSQTYEGGTYTLQVGDLGTGELLGTLSGRSAALALTDAGEGRVLMLAQNDDGQGLLVLASADGLRSSVIGERALFGR